MTQITQADLTRFQQELTPTTDRPTGDRAAFYLDYYNLTGSQNALFLAQISSFSGLPGGTAGIANKIDALSPSYPVGGVESFSLTIAQNILGQIITSVTGGGTGVLAETQLIGSAEQTWNQLKIGNLFPGNFLSLQALLTGNWSYFESHTQDVFTVGTGVGLFSGFVTAVGQGEIDAKQAYQNSVNQLLSGVFNVNVPPPDPLPSGYTKVTSADGKVTWVTDSAGAVVYGSVQAPLNDQFPTLSNPVQINIPADNGLNGLQLLLNGNGSGSIFSSDQAVNYTSGYTPSVSLGSSGNVQVGLTSGTGAPAITFNITASGVGVTQGSSTINANLPGVTSSVDSAGNVTLTSQDGSLTIPASAFSTPFSETISALSNGQELATVTNAAGTTATYYNTSGIFESVRDAASGNLTITSGGNTFTISGAQSIAPGANGQYTITDSQGRVYTLAPAANGDGNFTLSSANGMLNATIDPSTVTGFTLGTLDVFTMGNGDTLSINPTNGGATGNFDGSIQGFNQPSDFQIDNGLLRAGSASGGFATDYNLGSVGQVTSTNAGFLGLFTSGVSQDASAASSLETSVNGAVGLTTATGAVTNTNLPTIIVAVTGSLNGGLASAETSNTVAGGEVDGGTDFAVVDPTVNQNGLFANSPAGILSGNYQPAAQSLLSDTQNVAALLDQTSGDGNTPSVFVSNPLFDAFMADYADRAPDFSDIDPLLIGLSGNSIQLSNWINNNAYFDTNVGSSGQADGLLHHTSWIESGTGILGIDLNHDGKLDDITETLSQFFQGGPTPGKYADGLAALAALAPAGATSFNASTSLIDPSTGVSYFNEIVVWQDPGQNGASDAQTLQTLSQLGITSISLQGSGNVGENINGSAVTNRTTYTYTQGSTTQTGQIAAVNLQTDTTGDVTINADGGVIINSTPEGGPSASSSFVDKNTTAHNFTLNNGVLTDTTTSTVVGTGMDAMFATTQNDVITVNSSDTTSYWLGGGTGAATLTGGAGNTMFLINPATIVHGGTGFNIAQVTGNQSITVNLATDNLQEVVGGAGDGTFNASGTTWNAFIQGGSGNNIIIGGAANDALAGGTGNDLIEAGTGGSVIHAGSGNDVIYGGSGSTTSTTPVNINAGANTNTGYIERLYNGLLGREPSMAELAQALTWLNNATYTHTTFAGYLLGTTQGQSLYASESNTQFVNAIFQGLVGRAPQASELSSFVNGLNGGLSRATAVEEIADNSTVLPYWNSRHTGASDVIYGGAGQDTVILGTNNSDVFAGTGSMTVVGNVNGFSVVSFHDSYADYTMTHNADGSVTVTDKIAGSDGTVTVKNVTDFDFTDIKQVPINSTAGLPVNDTIQVSGNGPYVIAASALLANDIDYGGATLSISNLLDNNGNPIKPGQSGQVNGGSVSFSSDGSTITFTPTTGFNGIYSFRYNLTGSAAVQQITSGGALTGTSAVMSATVSLLTPGAPTNSGFPQEWYLQAADVLPAWGEGFTGAGVTVGVFDPSGNVDFTNPSLTPNAGGEFTSSGAPGIQQIGTHATLVAGVIASALNQGNQIGVAYNATLSSEAMTNGSVKVNTAFSNLADWSKYDVVNNSWGLTPPYVDSFQYNPTYAGYFQSAAQNGRGGRGTVIVFSGGNDRATGGNTEQSDTTANQYEITVGGINAPSDLGALQVSGAPFSNPGASILVSAPANNVDTTGTILTNQYGEQFGGLSEVAAGTSLSAPIVSGVVALMLQANPNLGARDVQEILADTATLVPDTNTTWSYNDATGWNGGGMHESYDYGFGEVDAAAAVRLAQTWTQGDTFANEAQTLMIQSPNLTIPTAGSSLPYIDFNNTGAAAPVIVQHIEVTLDVAFTGLTGSTQDQINEANALINAMNVTLTASNGASSTLMGPVSSGGGVATVTQNGQTVPVFEYTFDTVRNWGESDLQDYHVTLSYASGTTSTAGVVQSAQLAIYGDSVSASASTAHIYTNEFGSLGGDPNNAARSTLSDSSGNVTLNAAAMSVGSVFDLNPGSTDSVLSGRALTIASNTNIKTAYVGSGNNTIIGNSLGDTIDIVGQGTDTITASNATISAVSGDTVILTGSSANDTINIVGQGTVTVTASNTTINAPTGDTIILTGGSHNTVNASSGIIEVADASDTLNGSGNTTYQFGTSFGQADVINNNGGTSANGAINFALAAMISNLWFTQSGNDLIVQLLGTTDTIAVKGWFGSNAGSEVQAFNASGVTLKNTTVATLVSAMATYQAAHSAFSPATATQMPTDTTLQVAITNAWSGSASAVGVTIATAQADQAVIDAISGGYKVVDTAANVIAGLTFLASEANHIASIALTDSTTPTLALTTAQYQADAALLTKISSAYNLTVAGVAVAVLVGNNKTLNSSSGTDLLVGGAGDTVYLSNSPQVNFVQGSSNEVLYGSSNNVTTGTGVSLAVAGNSNTIGFNGDAGGGGSVQWTVIGNNNIVNASGANDVVHNGTGCTNNTYNVSNGTATIDSSGSGVVLNGSNNTVNAGTSASFTVNGNGNTVNGSSDTLAFSTGDASTIVVGNSNTISGGSSDQWVFIGNNDTVNTSGTNDTVDNGVGCLNNTYTMSNGTAIFEASTSGAVLNGGSNTVNAGTNANFTVKGNGNTVNGSSATVTFGTGVTNAAVAGSGNTVNASSGLNLVVSGANQLVNLSNAAQINFLQGSTNATVIGSNETIMTGTGVSFAVGGTGDTIKFNGDAGGGNGLHWIIVGSSNTINTSGTGDIVENGNGCTNNTYNVSNGTAVLDNSSSGVVLNGGNNTINAATNASFTVNGNGNSVNGASATFTFSAGDTSATVTGSGNAVNASSGINLTASGANQLVNLSNNTGSIDFLQGSTNATVIGSNETIQTGTGVSFAVGGSGNTIGFNGDAGGGGGINWVIIGNNNIVNAAGSNDIVHNGTGCTNNTYNVSNGTATIDNSGSGVVLNGSNNTVNAGTNASFTVSGNKDIVNASSDTVSFAANDLVASLFGSSDTINVGTGVNLMVTGGADTINASSATIILGASTTNIAIHGNNDTIHIRSGDTYTISGTGDTVITDTLVAAQNGTVIASYNGTSTLVDITGLAYDPTIAASFVQNSGGYAAQIKVNDQGSLIDTINLQAAQNLGNLTARPDGSGGTLLIDPPLPAAGNVDSKLGNQVTLLVQAMAAYASVNPGFNPATASAMPAGSALQATLAASWHH